jgi:hypothetical protein
VIEVLEKTVGCRSGVARKGSSIVTDCTARWNAFGRSEVRDPAALRRLLMLFMLAERGRIEKWREPSTIRGSLAMAAFVRVLRPALSDALESSVKEIKLAHKLSDA